MKLEPKLIKLQALSPSLPAQNDLPPYPVIRNPGSTILMLVVAGLLALLYFISARPMLQGDPASKSLGWLSAAIANEKTFAVDRYVADSGNAFLSNAPDFPSLAYFQGHYYSDQPPGMAFLAVPAYQLGQLLGDPFAFGLAFTALLAGGVLLLVYGLARRLGCSASAARFGAIAVGLASLLWRESGRFAPPVLSMLFLGLVLWLVLPPLPRDLTRPTFAKQDKIRLWRGFALGLGLGYAVVIEYSNAVWLLPIAAYLIWQKRATIFGWGGIVVGWVAGIAPLLLYNQLIFGKFYAFSYGFQIADESARRLTTQFLGGISATSLWQVFFGQGRAFLGLFILLFGVWGLLALWGQRGKREIAALFFALIALIALVAAYRYSVEGSGQAQSDFAATLVLPLALGAAVWHERFLFLTRMEQYWLPAFATFALSIHYFINPLGFPNLGGLMPVLPLIGLLALIGLLWRLLRTLSVVSKAIALLLVWAIFGLIGLSLTTAPFPTFAADSRNNLLNNPELKATNGQIAGWYISNEGKTLQPYILPVQGGKRYTFALTLSSANPTTLKVTWRWDDEAHQGLVALDKSYNVNTSATFSESVAAPPGAAYLQLTIASDISLSNPAFAFYDNGVRLEPMKNFATAAMAFSFDWESAMGGLIHSRGGAFSEGEAGGTALSDANQQEAVKYATQRGLEMRQGADNLLQMFQMFNIRATWYATGYDLLDGNPNRTKFADNPTYRWAGIDNRWGTDFWKTNAWYKYDPYGTYETDPAWYFGDQASRFFAAGQEIASHTFGHLYVKATTTREFEADLSEWQYYAKQKGFPPARTFAFPWQSSNSLGKEHYDVLYNAGFRVVTRLNLTDQQIKADGEGNLWFGTQNLTPTPPPDNPYYYLTRPRYAPKNGKEGAFDPRFYVLHDYQLLPGAKSEANAIRVINDLLGRRGSYGSLWTHPEAAVNEADRNSWLRVITYAANARANGLWVDTVEALVQHRLDVSKVQVNTVWQNGGLTAKITLINPTNHPIEGLTLTMPRPIESAPLAIKIRDSQLIVPTLPPNGSITIEVKLK